MFGGLGQLGAAPTTHPFFPERFCERRALEYPAFNLQPSTFNIEGERDKGVVARGRLGQAWTQGPMQLVWNLVGGPRNVALRPAWPPCEAITASPHGSQVSCSSIQGHSFLLGPRGPEPKYRAANSSRFSVPIDPLHREQSGRMFSREVGPPLLTGTTCPQWKF